MRALMKRGWLAVTMACTSLFGAALALAQDGSSGATETTTRSTSTTSWWVEPWVWGVVIGVAVFLIVVIALTNRGGSRSA